MRDPDPQNLRNRLAALKRRRESCRPENADKVNEDDAEIAVIEERLEREEQTMTDAVFESEGHAWRLRNGESQPSRGERCMNCGLSWFDHLWHINFRPYNSAVDSIKIDLCTDAGWPDQRPKPDETDPIVAIIEEQVAAVTSRKSAAPRPLAIPAEEHATRLWLEALVAAGWTIYYHWWDEPPAGATREEFEKTALARRHMDKLTVDEALELMREPVVRSYEFTGPGRASFSICGWGLCGGGH